MTSKAPSGWLAQLDGVRGISILMVLTAHVYASGWPRHLEGRYGVRVFFVLSGFLITRLLLCEESDTGGISLLAFYVRRAFRLFPIYYLVLAVYCILILGFGIHADGRQGFARALPYYLTYMQDVPFFRDNSADPIAMPFGHSWSLGIEEKFYLLWPILAFQVLQGHKARIALVAGATCFFSMARFIPYGQFIYPYAAISCGCLFALLCADPDIQKRLEGWVSSWRVPVVLLSWPVLHAMVALKALPVSLQLAGELIYPVSIAFVIVASLRSPWLAHIFSFSPLVILGRYSYCIYLIHLLVRQAVERVLVKMGVGAGNGLLIYTLMLVFSTAGAGVLYYAVEAKFRDVGRRIARGWSRKPKPSISLGTLDDLTLGAARSQAELALPNPSVSLRDHADNHFIS